jgi:outer membrane protein assembly factor BamB
VKTKCRHKKDVLAAAVLSLLWAAGCSRALLLELPYPGPPRNPGIMDRFPSEPLWKHKLPGSPGRYMTRVDSLVLIHTRNGHIELLNPSTGKALWHRHFRNRSGIMPVPDDSVLFVAWQSGKPSVSAIDYLTGREIWSAAPGPQSAVPCIAGHSLVIGTSRVLAGLSKTTGEIRWRTGFRSGIRGIVSAGGLRVAAVSESGEIKLVSVTDGQCVFQDSMDPEIACPPLYDRGILFIANTGGTIRAVRPADGARLWETKIPEGIFKEGAVDGESLYWGTSSGFFTAIDRVSGTVRWQVRTAGAAGTAPVLLEEHVVFGRQDKILNALLKRDGTCVWETVLEGRVKTNPLMAGDVLIAGSDPNWIYGYRSAQ